MKNLMPRRGKALQNQKFQEYDLLRQQQTELYKIRPWMTHSFSEASIPVVFHIQILVDFKTVIEMCDKMLTILP
jgi:hypothetical protein